MDCIICGNWFSSFIHDGACPTCSRAIKQLGLNMTPDRLRELAQAEKDGRLVVLPDVKYTDADGEKALQNAMWTCGNTNNPVTRYTADAIAEKLCREAKEDNPPLTLEELREMNREPAPVWCEKFGWRICYGVTEFRGYPCMETGAGCCIHLNDYGKTWLAYRRKPEEGMTYE